KKTSLQFTPMCFENQAERCESGSTVVTVSFQTFAVNSVPVTGEIGIVTDSSFMRTDISLLTMLTWNSAMTGCVRCVMATPCSSTSINLLSNSKPLGKTFTEPNSMPGSDLTG